jgi:hypothetical protein
VNASKTNDLRTSLAAQESAGLLSPTMYLVRLRAHLSRGRIALGEVMDAVTEVLPLPRSQKDRGPEG